MTKTTKITVSFALGLIPTLLLAYEYGPNVRNTAGPGDNPLGCSQSSCHTGLPQGGPLLTSAAGSNGVFASFSSGSTYTPGVPMTITVMVKDPVNIHYGFQMSARLEDPTTHTGSATLQAGNFTVGSTVQLILCDNGTLGGVPITPTGCPVSTQVQFIEHSYPAGSQVSTTPYVFTWTPPATNAGNIYFYVAGNAVNGDLMADAADHVYANSYMLTPAVCTLSPPTITAVQSAGAFGALSAFTSGSWLEVYGTNLAPDTRSWLSSDFTGNNAPTSLDGSSVSVNGNAGYIDFISAGQINVQAPADTATGPVPITVTNCAGTSAPVMLTRAAFAPGVLAPPSFNVGGKQYLAALFPDGVTFVGNTGLVSGVPFKPAAPGAAVTTYGVGFGAVNPAIAPGIIETVSNGIAGTFSMSIGGVSVTPTYFGLAPNFVGLYQFNFAVPSVPNGDQPVTFSVGGVQAQTGLLLTVHN
jgi:uncharacterized protein (TIGR03437 family)